MSGIAEPLVENLQAFIAFTRKRVGDLHLAEDLVQESLLKALNAEQKPTADEEVTTWFYRILRRAIIDLYRRQGARKRALEKLKTDFPQQPDAAAERVLCQCFKRLLPELPAQYREVLQKIDLEGRSPKEAAPELGISANNLTVRLHRARQKLRSELERSCRVCAKHGCLDCSCEHPDGSTAKSLNGAHADPPASPSGLCPKNATAGFWWPGPRPCSTASLNFTSVASKVSR